MERIFGASKIFIAMAIPLILAGCGSSSGQIDDLFGSNNSPVLTSIANQIVQQTNEVIVDVNNIQVGVPGNDLGMTYSCYYDTLVDDSVDETLDCTAIPNSTSSFDPVTGILRWTPSLGVLGNYEFKITGTSESGRYSEVFTIGSRLKFDGIDSFTNISGVSVVINWTPNLAAIGYQVYKLNTLTGQYEFMQSVTGGAVTSYNLPSLIPNSPYTLRVVAIDALGFPDGNVVSRSFTTNSLTKFSMSPTSGTIPSGTAQPIVVQAFNSNDTPQVVGGLTVIPGIQSGTSTGTFSPVIDNNDGTYSFNFTPNIVDTPVAIEVTSNTTFFLLNTSNFTIVPGAPSNSTSSINISSNSVVSGNAVTVVATVKDAQNNPITSGSTITFNKTGGTSTGTFSAVTNAGNGVYTATYTGVVAGSAQTLSVSVNGTPLTPTTTIQVLPGAPSNTHSTLAISSSSILSGAVATVTATLKDLNNNPVPSGILVAFNKAGGTSSGSFSAVVNAGAGVYTTTYTGLVSGTAQTLTVVVDGVTLTPNVNVTVTPGAPYLANSTLTISNPTVVSAQFVTVTATLKDLNNNPIDSGITVTFSKTGGTSTGTFGSVTNQGNGVYNIRYTGVTAGTSQNIAVLVNGVDLGAATTVTVVPGAPSNTLSTIAVSAPTVVSGNSVTITATLRDTNNNLISSGVLVGISVTGGSSTGSLSAITNAGNGVYTATYTGVLSGSAQTLGIISDGSNLGPSTGITVLPGAVNVPNSALVINNTSIISGGFATVTATLKDTNNNPISTGSTVTFTKTGGTSTGTFSTVISQGNGVYTVNYTGVIAGTDQTIRVLINGVDVGFTVTIGVTPGAPSPTQSAITVSSATVVSGAIVTATATIRDANSNPINSGILVTFSKTGGSSTGLFSSVTFQGNGQYAINYEGVASGTAQTIGVIVDGSNLGPTTTITVTPGAPASLLSTFTVSSATVISGSTVTLTATVKDANNNPISSGLVIGFDKIGGTSYGTLSAITNQGSGVYTAVYTGITAGTANTLQTTVNGTGFGPTQTIQVLVGAPYLANSSLTVAPTTLSSGATATISAVIRDVNNNPITSEYAILFDTLGGSSTGTLGTMNNAGGGSFTNTYQGLVAGTAQTVRVLADGTPIAGLTRTIQVIPGVVDPANSTFQISNATVQSGSTVNLTMNLRDANNNAVSSGLTVTFNKTAGVSNGTISGVSNGGNGNYSATYTGTTQGAAQTITLVANGTTISALNVSVSVTAGAPTKMAITGPANPLNSIDCNGPYNVVLQDAANNTTSSISSFTMPFSSGGSAHSGTIFSDASCTSIITNLAFAASQTNNNFYYKSYLPQSITLTLTPSIGTIAANSQALNNIPVISWIGSAGEFTMVGSGNEMVADDTNGLYNPQDAVADGNFLYVVEATYNRIVKYNVVLNEVEGWIGHVGSTEGITAYDGSTSCDGLNVATGDQTPVWCRGGRSNTVTAGLITGLKYITVDNTYIYVTAGSHRILRFNKTSGAYGGWIGRINASPATGVCASSNGLAAPGWCVGGTSQLGTLDGMLNNPQSIVHHGGYLYVADYANQRVQRFVASSGAGAGWVGLTNASPQNWAGQLPTCSSIPATDVRTPGWCLSGTTGTAKTSNRYNLSNNPTELVAPDEGFYNPIAITTDGTYLYVGDTGNVRVVRINLTSGAFSGYIGSALTRTAPNNIPVPATLGTTYTSNWTEKGITYPRDGTNGFGTIRGLTTDGTHLYISDDYHRVIKVQLADGQDFRWIGRVSSSPTGGFIGCSSTPVSGVTPGWCLGGQASRVGNTNNAFYSPYGLTISGTKLYVADYNNFRIQSLDLADGFHTGWIGTATVPSTKWSRTIAAGAKAARIGIDDYSNLETGTGYNSISMNSTYMFETDFASARIKRFNRLTGQMLGYIGIIGTFAPTGPAGCVGFTSGMTPDWCTGGGRTSSGSGIHGYNNPYSVTSDNTYIYIANYSNHRVDRVRISDALYQGWIGKINAVPTDGGASCTGANSGDPTQTWCIGGTAINGTINGNFNAPRVVYYDSPYLYVTDNTARLMRINPTNGAFDGVIGHVTAGTVCTITNNVAQGWCTTTATGGGGSTGYGSINAASGIATNTSHIFVSDTSNHRISRYVKGSGAPAGIIGRIGAITNLSSTGYCVGQLANKPLKGWCGSTVAGAALPTSATAEDGAFNTPRAIWANDTYLYVADSYNHRIVRISATDGSFQGWKGYIADLGTGPTAITPTACATAGVGGITPTWCTGGSSGPAKQLGGFDDPVGLYGDANYLYVKDGRNNRTVTIPLN